MPRTVRSGDTPLEKSIRKEATNMSRCKQKMKYWERKFQRSRDRLHRVKHRAQLAGVSMKDAKLSLKAGKLIARSCPYVGPSVRQDEPSVTSDSDGNDTARCEDSDDSIVNEELARALDEFEEEFESEFG